MNDGPLEPDQIALLTASHAELPMEELRKRYAQDGYVFIKGLIPRQDILTARRKYFDMLAPTGVLKPGTNSVAGIFDSSKNSLNFPGIGAGVQGSHNANGDLTGPDAETAKRFGELALKAHHEEWYIKDLCQHPKIHDFVANLTGWGQNTKNIRRTLLRNNTPGNKAIGVHYDHIFLRHGEDTFVTAWVPIGDIKINGGGLIYLEQGL